MPTYEYKCTKCSHAFEAFQRISDDPLSRCPKCQGKVRRMIGGGMGVIFKGSGFYTTDYKRNSSLTGGKNGSGKDKEAPKEPAASSSSTSSSASTTKSD